MKKAFRIILPIILVLAILLTSIWYLFVYDRELTRDMLLACARYFEDSGKHSTAQWFYDVAYSQVDDNDAIAIERANLYKEHGNYTKAEYTLYKAIQDGGGVDLYIALSRLYIEQDKLLDAADLLNNVTGYVKTELEKRRPAMPTISPDPGFYSQYITVTLKASNGTLYVNPNGQYPSIHTDKYTGPVTLTEGENTIYAIVVSTEGLVSPLAIYGYTLGGIVEVVNFADPAIESQVRNTLGVPESTTLYTNDLWDITEFVIPEDAQNYSDLKHMTSLEKLTIQNGVSGQLDFLSVMPNMKELTITGTTISSDELSIIGSLTSMQKLTLKNCGISTTSPLKNLSAVTYIDLSENTIRDISALSNMSALQEIYLSHNALSEVSALKECKMLRILDISHNEVPTLFPLLGLIDLAWLDASNNHINDLNGIYQLSKLEYLHVNYNQLTDISPVVQCAALVDFGCSNNKLTDISSIGKMNDLMYFDFSYNQVAKLPGFSKDSNLVTINGAHNKITSLAPLSGLPMLNNVLMDYNADLKSVAELENCYLLMRVEVYGTKVKDVGMLTSQSVIVIYDPTNK